MRFVACCIALMVYTLQYGQVNAYAKITGISGNVISLSNVNQTYASFSAGQKIIIIQMQGADISGYTADNASFGNINAIAMAGSYEIAMISAINASATSATLTANLSSTYDVNNSVQAVTYPQLGSTNYTTSANIDGIPWDGNVGGVVAFQVRGNLYLGHSINASGIGFRGGTKSGEDASTCEGNVWRIATSTKYAAKGEGVYITASSEKGGKAKAANGGGGGIVHNGGGGGGGNYTAGGDGYLGYAGSGCTSTLSAGGQGGVALPTSVLRAFMGGGGGGAHENNNGGSNGANGGGVIFLNCDTLIVSGACSSVSINANGLNASAAANDGAGGGGAGGTIIMQVKNIKAISACPLTISASGGNGGSINNSASHGAGGGGGQGAIYISANGPFSNTTLLANNGAGGSANNGASPPTAGSGSGTSGSGAMTGAGITMLPQGLTYFEAHQYSPGIAELTWQTASEKNSKWFEVYYSADGDNWKLLGEVKAAGNSSTIRNYTFLHTGAEPPISYYRLKYVDFTGGFIYSNIIYVQVKGVLKARAYPNPASSVLIVEPGADVHENNLTMKNLLGETIPVPFEKKGFQYVFDLSGLPAGIYFLESSAGKEKIVINK